MQTITAVAILQYIKNAKNGAVNARNGRCNIFWVFLVMFRFSTSTLDLKPRKQDHVISDKYRTSHADTHEILLIEEKPS